MLTILCLMKQMTNAGTNINVCNCKGCKRSYQYYQMCKHFWHLIVSLSIQAAYMMICKHMLQLGFTADVNVTII